MLKAILFCAILAYLSGVEARRREYAPSYTETTTSEYGVPQRVRNRHEGKHFEDGFGPTTWTNVNGHMFYKYYDEWGYTGDVLTYTLIEISMFDDGTYEIVFKAEDGYFVKLTEDAAYERREFDDDYKWFAGGYFTFRKQKGRNVEEEIATTTPEYSVRRRLRNRGRHFDVDGPTSWTNNNNFVYKKLSGVQWDYTGDDLNYTLIEIYMNDIGHYEIVLQDSNGRYVKLTEDAAYESMEYDDWYKRIGGGFFTFRAFTRNEEVTDTTTPEYSVRRRLRNRGKSLEDHTETTTPEYSVRRLAIKIG